MMKVLLVNGSPHKEGCTYTALCEVGDTLNGCGVDADLFWIGNRPLSGCIACHRCSQQNCCVIQDTVNEFLDIAGDYDGFVFGSPVHWGGATGAITSFLDRAFYADLNGNGNRFYLKPAAAVLSARRAGTTASWDQLNKYFGLMQMPIIMGDYYDVSQTIGRPIKEPVPLIENTARMETALGALMNYSPVPIVEQGGMPTPARYDETHLCLAIDPSYGELEVFSALATEIGYAQAHDKGRNIDFDRETYRVDAESVSYMLCRRFGVDCKPPQAAELAQLYEGYEPSDRGEALEQLRKTTRNMGDGIDRAIQPRQQERSRRHLGAR